MHGYFPGSHAQYDRTIPRLWNVEMNVNALASNCIPVIWDMLREYFRVLFAKLHGGCGQTFPRENCRFGVFAVDDQLICPFPTGFQTAGNHEHGPGEGASNETLHTARTNGLGQGFP